MPNIQIKDVSPEVHERLTARARREGRSLQQYLLAELERIARVPTDDELFDEIERHGHRVPLAPGAAVRAVRAGRPDAVEPPEPR
jgi:hypothetical protein